jgi:serine protease AprX
MNTDTWRNAAMRRIAVPLIAISLFLLPAAHLGAAPEPAPIDPLITQIEGRQGAFVHVRPGGSLTEAQAAAEAAGATLGTNYHQIGVFLAYGEAAVFQEVALSSEVEWIEANRVLEYLTDTSHVATRGQQVLDGAVKAGRKVIDGSGVGVAVIDSGIDASHPDLDDRVALNLRIVCTVPGGAIAIGGGTGLGFSECRGPKTFVPMENTDVAGGHGTHVSGIIAGTGQASGGTYHGAAPGASLYGLASGTVLTVENAMDGLRWVLENHDQVSPAIRVVNNSWGSGYRKADENDPLTGAMTKLQNAVIADGVTVVFAAGNSGGTGANPTTSVQCVNTTPGNVCVASTYDRDAGDRNGPVSSFSSRGKADNTTTPADEADPATWPDISAPGQFIVSTCRYTLPVCWAHAGQVGDPPNAYSELSGTSMAAPHISGIVAQLYQVKPGLTPAQVEDFLEDSAYKFSFDQADNFDASYSADPFNPDDASSFDKGHGIVDVVAAVRMVRRKA